MSKLKLDKWQQEVLEADGNIVLRSGRQVGKSTIISVKAAEYALNNPNKTILIISAVERQSYLLFEKVLAYMADNYKPFIKGGVSRPTKHLINLKNGSKIYSLPTGLTGYGIRGYTVDMLIADEAAFIPEDVWTAVTPMLAITRGKIILLSTPFGRSGYFYRCFEDESFKSFHISALDCPRANHDFLDRERKRMSNMQFQQEYEGLFVDELRQFFPEEVIQGCLTLDTKDVYQYANKGTKYMGVDIARLGEDSTVLASVVKTPGLLGDTLNMIDLEITNKTRLTDTIDLIKIRDSVHNFTQIYIDDAGVGGGVFDVLLKDDQTKRKVVAINNSSRPLVRDDSRKKKILKEDLYANLLRLMETHGIQLFNDDEISLSLRSVQYEYSNGTLKIFGKYTHIAEALIRAAWCVQDKHLNMWVRY